MVAQKLALAQDFGATHFVNAKDTSDVPSAIRELTGGLGVDYAFEVIGAPAVVSQAYLSVKRGGAVVVVGVVPFGQDVAIPGMMLALEEKSLIGCLYGSGNLRRDMPRLIDLYMEKKLKLDELVSRRIKLDDVNAAFEAMEKGEVARSVITY
jgi:Zn-dependent alcohol dehydrogenase